MANEEDVLVDLSENIIEDKSTPKRKGNKVRARRWTDEETDILIDMFEESACLWDIFSKDYHLKDKRDKAYEKIQEELDIPITEIKNKIIGLRSQLSREVAKTNQKKSGQGVSENYKTSWVYWDRLQFLIPVIRAGKSKDTLQAPETLVDRQSTANPNVIDENDSQNQENWSQNSRTKSFKRKAEHELTSKKHEVLERCLNVLKEPLQPQEKRQCHFSMYIAEKLANFDRRTRMIAEKRINDIIFELEMGDHSSQSSLHHVSNSMQGGQGTYMGMLQTHAPQYHGFS